jgi:hypothetical protein
LSRYAEVIALLERERDVIEQALRIVRTLAGRPRGRPPKQQPEPAAEAPPEKRPQRRQMSAAGRAAIIAANRRRWARVRRAKKG